MKKKTGAVIFVFLVGIILGATQAALLYAASTSGGYVWDEFVDTSPFTWGTKLTGPLSIYYAPTSPATACAEGSSYEAVLYMTVRLGYKGVNYTFSAPSSQAICLTSYSAQWNEVKAFLTYAVGQITSCGNENCWKLKAFENAKPEMPGPDAFVADITIGVKE